MEIPKKEMLLTHVAKNFSSLADYRYGPEIIYANIPWRIGYRKKENQDIGVYLYCRRARTDKIWSVTTNISMRILSVNGKNYSQDISYTYANNSEFTSYGYAFSFATLLKDYVVDDTLVFEVKMAIESMTGIEKPETKRSFEKSAEEPSDVVLKVNEQKFHVNKAHLIAQSEHFKKLLMEKKDEIELKNINPDVFQVFLEVIYMEDSLTDDNIEDVLELVKMYDAKNVARLCEHFLIIESKLSLRTQFQIATEFKFEKLKNHCFESLTSRADVRAVIAFDPSQLDASICHILLEKLITLKL